MRFEWRWSLFLRIIADKLADKAEQGDIQAIREIADGLDGKGNTGNRVGKLEWRARLNCESNRCWHSQPPPFQKAASGEVNETRTDCYRFATQLCRIGPDGDCYSSTLVRK